MTADERAVLLADEQRLKAMAANDFPALDRLLADELHYIHSTSNPDTKTSFIELLRSGTVRYLEAHRSETAVRVYGDSAVLSGIVVFEVSRAGAQRTIRGRYVTHWIRRDGRWQMTAVASVPIPSGK